MRATETGILLTQCAITESSILRDLLTVRHYTGGFGDAALPFRDSRTGRDAGHSVLQVRYDAGEAGALVPE